MKKFISFLALSLMVVAFTTSCTTRSGHRVAKSHYAAITLEDGGRGVLLIDKQYSHILTPGDKVYVRPAVTDKEKSVALGYRLVVNVKADTNGVLSGFTLIDSGKSTRVVDNIRATPATVDSLFRM